MHLRSLSLQTDLIFHRFNGELAQRSGYVRVHTPSNPGFFYGNFLLFPKPPVAGDLERWEELFSKEFAEMPEVRHRCFVWDGVDGATGECAPFVRVGYALELAVILTAAP